jgi:hypothetical protein
MRLKLSGSLDGLMIAVFMHKGSTELAQADLV